MDDFAIGILGNLIADLIAVAIATAAAFWYFRSGARNAFRVRDPAHVEVVVSASKPQDTGEYPRPVTGLGQVQAIAQLAPRFSRAYPKRRLERIRTSDDQERELERDLVCLGGDKTNVLTKKLLARLHEEDSSFPVVPSEGSNIVWNGTPFASSGEEGVKTKDYGLVVRAPNPFGGDEGTRVILVAGASTYGVHAAAKALVTKRQLQRWDCVAALVSCEVSDGLPICIKVVKLARRRNGVWSETRA